MKKIKYILAFLLAITSLAAHAENTKPDITVTKITTTGVTSNVGFKVKDSNEWLKADADGKWTVTSTDTPVHGAIGEKDYSGFFFQPEDSYSGSTSTPYYHFTYALADINDPANGIVVDPTTTGGTLLAKRRAAALESIDCFLIQASTSNNSLYVIIYNGKVYGTDDIAKATKFEAYQLAYADHNVSCVQTALPATCNDDGHNAVYQCSICQKYFKEQSCEIETTLADEEIPAGHRFEYVSTGNHVGHDKTCVNGCQLSYYQLCVDENGDKLCDLCGQTLSCTVTFGAFYVGSDGTRVDLQKGLYDDTYFVQPEGGFKVGEWDTHNNDEVATHTLTNSSLSALSSTNMLQFHELTLKPGYEFDGWYNSNNESASSDVLYGRSGPHDNLYFKVINAPALTLPGTTTGTMPRCYEAKRFQFTPEQSGVYKFDVTMPEGYMSNFEILTLDNFGVAMNEENEACLEAGTTYRLLLVFMPDGDVDSNASIPYTITTTRGFGIHAETNSERGVVSISTSEQSFPNNGFSVAEVLKAGITYTLTAELADGQYTFVRWQKYDASTKTYKSYSTKPTITVSVSEVTEDLSFRAVFYKPGDVNCDNEFTIADVNSLVKMLLGTSSKNAVADVNRDGKVDISDISALIDRLNR